MRRLLVIITIVAVFIAIAQRLEKLEVRYYTRDTGERLFYATVTLRDFVSASCGYDSDRFWYQITKPADNQGLRSRSERKEQRLANTVLLNRFTTIARGQ